jgi:hypothetical protein
LLRDCGAPDDKKAAAFSPVEPVTAVVSLLLGSSFRQKGKELGWLFAQSTLPPTLMLQREDPH